MSDIFVSYASEDRAFVDRLVQSVEQQGFSVWWDKELIAGHKFDERIEQALDACCCVVVVWSANSVASRWCRAEAGEGLERDCLVPVRIDDVRLPLVFRGEQTASLVGWPDQEAEFGSLLSGIERYVSAIPARREEPEDQENSVPASSPAALAVLPFRNISPDPDHNFLVEGITRDLTELLSMNPDISVTPHSTVEHLVNSGKPLHEMGDELRVRYLVSGGIESRGERFRLRVSVEDTRAKSQIWSKHYDEPIATFYDVQDQLEQTISTAIGTEVDVASVQGIAKRGKFDLSAYELIQLTEDKRRTYSKEASDFIVKTLQGLVTEDPDNAVAHAHLAIQLSQNLVSRWADIPAETARSMSEHIARARALAPHDPRVLTATGIVALMSGEHAQAVDLLSLSLEINPNDPHANAVYGVSLALLGQYDAGLAYIDGALAAAPHHPRCAIWWSYAAVAHRCADRVDEARRAFDMAIRINPNYHVSYFWRAFFSIEQGNLEHVKADISRALSLAEGLSFEELKQGNLRMLGPSWSELLPWDRFAAIWSEVEAQRS